MKMNKTEIYRKALDHWGLELQVGMLTEEMAELTIAVNKYRREPCNARLRMVAEEMEDVRIMIEQIRVAFQIPPSWMVEYRSLKLNKLKKMLEGKLK